MELLRILLFVNIAGQFLMGTFARAMPKFPFRPNAGAQLSIDIPEDGNVNHFGTTERKKRSLWLIPVAFISGLAIGKYFLSSEENSDATNNYNTSNTNTHYNMQKSIEISLNNIRKHSPNDVF